MSALLVQVINIFVVLVFYQLLKPVNKTMARLMVIFLLLGVSVLSMCCGKRSQLVSIASAKHLKATWSTDELWRVLSQNHAM